MTHAHSTIHKQLTPASDRKYVCQFRRRVKRMSRKNAFAPYQIFSNRIKRIFSILNRIFRLKCVTTQSQWCFNDDTVVPPPPQWANTQIRADQISWQNSDLHGTLTPNMSKCLCVCVPLCDWNTTIKSFEKWYAVAKGTLHAESVDATTVFCQSHSTIVSTRWAIFVCKRLTFDRITIAFRLLLHPKHALQLKFNFYRNEYQKIVNAIDIENAPKMLNNSTKELTVKLSRFDDEHSDNEQAAMDFRDFVERGQHQPTLSPITISSTDSDGTTKSNVDGKMNFKFR